MDFLINFIIIFIVVYVAFYFISVRKARKNSKKVPVEVQYLLIRYQIDLKKIRYKKFVNSIAIVGSIDIAIVGSIVLFVQNLLLQLLVGFVLLVPIILVSFFLLGRYYQKRSSNGEEISEVLESESEVKPVKTVVREKRKRVKGERRNG